MLVLGGLGYQAMTTIAMALASGMRQRMLAMLEL
jgi:ABC-type uncharacterized transport system YnjBCD permease subunit